MQQFSVIHSTHDGTDVGEVFPENLDFVIHLSDVGGITYDLDLNHPMAVRRFTEAYVTDYRIVYTDAVGSLPIQAGMHTAVEVDDLDSDILKVAGKEWRHWLERTIYPFNPANPTANLYLAFQRDIFTVVQEIVASATSLPNSLPLTFATPGQLSTFLINYRIDAGDTEYMLSKLNALAQGDPGFDFDISWDKKISLYYPKKGVYNTQVVFETGRNIHRLTFSERGIDGTRVLGLGSGTASRIGRLKENVTASGKYRRHDVVKDFGNVNDATLVDTLATAELARASAPIASFSCTYIPDATIDFWRQVHVGDIVQVRADLRYDQIDADYRLIAIEGRPDDEGNMEIALTFDDATLSL